MNISQVREAIVTLLSDGPNLLGKYIFPDSTEVPAVYVVGQNSVPNEWQVTGLELTIRQYPEVLPNAGVGVAVVLQQWEVVLVQYNPDGKEVDGYDPVVWAPESSVGILDYDDDEISTTSALPPEGYDEFSLSDYSIQKIADAMDRMARRFPDATFRYTPGDDIAYERCRIIIPDMTIRRLYAEP